MVKKKYKYYDINTRRPIKLLWKRPYIGYMKVQYSDGSIYTLDIDTIRKYKR